MSPTSTILFSVRRMYRQLVIALLSSVRGCMVSSMPCGMRRLGVIFAHVVLLQRIIGIYSTFFEIIDRVSLILVLIRYVHGRIVQAGRQHPSPSPERTRRCTQERHPNLRCQRFGASMPHLRRSCPSCRS